MFRAFSSGVVRQLLRVLALSVALLHGGAYAQGLLALTDQCHCTHAPGIPCDCPHMASDSGEDESKLPPCHRKLLQEKRAAEKSQAKVRNRCSPPGFVVEAMPEAVLSPNADDVAVEPSALTVVTTWQPSLDCTARPAAPPPRA